MALSHLVKELQIDDVVFGSTVKPPGSANTLFLGGAGVRGLQISGEFIKFTAIGIYMEEHAVPSLAVKWKGKSADELTDSVDFFMDIVAGPFEKFTRVTMIMPLGGAQYAEKVSENCVALMKSVGKYGEAEAQGVEKLVQAFKDESFPPGSSILFTHSPSAGTLTIRFSEDGSVPEKGSAVIENKAVSEAVLNSIIGENGVSPDAKRSLALRLCELMKESKFNGEAAEQM